MQSKEFYTVALPSGFSLSVYLGGKDITESVLREKRLYFKDSGSYRIFLLVNGIPTDEGIFTVSSLKSSGNLTLPLAALAPLFLALLFTLLILYKKPKPKPLSSIKPKIQILNSPKPPKPSDRATVWGIVDD
jgi:hypothetical protein